jgi:hypothetical protein
MRMHTANGLAERARRRDLAVIIEDAAKMTRAATRTRLAKLATAVGILLLVHAILGFMHHWPTQLFGFHLGVSIVLGIAAVLQADRRRRAIDRVADAIRDREAS